MKDWFKTLHAYIKKITADATPYSRTVLSTKTYARPNVTVKGFINVLCLPLKALFQQYIVTEILVEKDKSNQFNNSRWNTYLLFVLFSI